MKSLLVGLFFLSIAQPILAADRFFYEGDGEVALKNLKTGQKQLLNYRTTEDQKKINRLFGVPIKEPLNISLRFVALLDYLQDRFVPQKTILLKSAYRSPKYNQSLRDRGGTVAKASMHMEGMAADIILPGVSTEKVWETLREEKVGGVGWYGGDTIHVDTGPARWWTGASAKTKTNISEHNKKILLRTDFDRYQLEENVQLSLVRITYFPIQINKDVKLIDSTGKKAAKLQLQGVGLAKQKDCYLIDDRHDGRQLSVQLPKKRKLRGKKLQFEMSFCEKPFEEMPSNVFSNNVLIAP